MIVVAMSVAQGVAVSHCHSGNCETFCLYLFGIYAVAMLCELIFFWRHRNDL